MSMIDFERHMADIRVKAAREALRRCLAGEPAHDEFPMSTCAYSHLGTLQAHVEILAETVERLLTRVAA